MGVRICPSSKSSTAPRIGPTMRTAAARIATRTTTTSHPGTRPPASSAIAGSAGSAGRVTTLLPRRRGPRIESPMHQETLAAADVERDVLEDDLRTECLGQVLDFEHDFARARRVGQLDLERALRLRRVHLLRAHAFHARVECLRSPGPALRLVAHDVGERLQPLDLRLLARRELAPACLVLFPCDEVLRVGALVFDELAVVEVQDAGDRLVQQREVVADDEQRAAERAEEVHQPGFGVDVEVVRRFVEQQQLVAGEQDARELDPPAFATGERLISSRADPRPGRARRRCGAPRLPPRTRRRSRTLLRRSSRRARSSVDGSLSTATWSSARRCAARSRPRPDSTCDSAVGSTPAPRDGGSWRR